LAELFQIIGKAENFIWIRGDINRNFLSVACKGNKK
jgi:hypothetical protein